MVAIASTEGFGSVEARTPACGMGRAAALPVAIDRAAGGHAAPDHALRRQRVAPAMIEIAGLVTAGQRDDAFP